MKKSIITTAILCLLSVFAYAQPYTSFTITNNTSCTVYIMVAGNVSTGPCVPDYRSSVLAIAPGTTTFSDAGSVTGGMWNRSSSAHLNSGDHFNYVEVYSSIPLATNNCPFATYNLSDCYPPMITSYSSKDFYDWDQNTLTCNSCGTWDIDLTGMGSTLMVDIQ